MSVRVFAPAKINLTLEVGALKDNGRHPLQSMVVFADVGDWVEARAGAELSLSIDGPFAKALSDTEDNLVLRAARALAEAAGLGAPAATLRLTKNLPVASGIGGGSSDAAAALKALNALWRLGFDQQRLTTIGAQLGGDVPVCLHGASAYMSGEGEVVTPVSTPALHAVLANPGVAVSTGSVFAQFDSLGGGNLVASPAPLWRSLQDVCAGIAARGNDLARPARIVAPAIARMEAALAVDPDVRCVSLSGSGATLFALTETQHAAANVAQRLRAGFPECWTTPTTLALDPGPEAL